MESNNLNQENDPMLYGYCVDEHGNFLFETHKYGLYWWKDKIKEWLHKR